MKSARHKHRCPFCPHEEPCKAPEECAKADTRDMKVICPACAIARGRGEVKK